MSTRPKVSVTFNPTATAAKFTGRVKLAQAWLDNEVLKDSTPYVPRLTGELERSGIAGTKIGSGGVVYNKIYAKDQYYRNFKHSAQSHPKATRTWFETAKAINKRKWTAGVKRLTGGGF